MLSWFAQLDGGPGIGLGLGLGKRPRGAGESWDGPGGPGIVVGGGVKRGAGLGGMGVPGGLHPGEWCKRSLP